MKILGLIVIVSMVGACGSDDSELEALAGIYQTTKHTLNDEDCQAEGPDLTDMPYFQLVLEDLLGTKYLAFGSCESADSSTCSGAGLFDAWIKRDGEIQHEVQMTSGGGEYGPCSLSLKHGTLTQAGDSVGMQIRSYHETDDTLTDEECDLDEVEARGTSMPCSSYEIIEGTRVP